MNGTMEVIIDFRQVTRLAHTTQREIEATLAAGWKDKSTCGEVGASIISVILHVSCE